MKLKYIAYVIGFFILVGIFTFGDSSAKTKKPKSDTINIFFDKLDNSFYINKYEIVSGHRERILGNNDIIIQDSSGQELKYKICIEKTSKCLEKDFNKNIKHSIHLEDGLYNLSIQTTDRTQIIRNRFYLRNLPLE